MGISNTVTWLRVNTNVTTGVGADSREEETMSIHWNEGSTPAGTFYMLEASKGPQHKGSWERDKARKVKTKAHRKNSG